MQGLLYQQYSADTSIKGQEEGPDTSTLRNAKLSRHLFEEKEGAGPSWQRRHWSKTQKRSQEPCSWMKTWSQGCLRPVEHSQLRAILPAWGVGFEMAISKSERK